MECPNCHESCETGASFCGNCGQPLQTAVPSPDYALALPAQQKGETQALLSILFGAVGLAGSVFLALAGLGFGLAGLVMGTVGRQGFKKRSSNAGIVLSCLALLAGLAVWTYAYDHTNSIKAAHLAATNGPTVATNNLSTPCYSLGFADKLNINNNSNSCDMRAFNGQSLETSTDAYKVYASQSSISDAGSFTTAAKSALEKDVQTNLPGYSLVREQVSAFAGSPAYVVVASYKHDNVTVAEEAVFHATTAGDNTFILVHAVSGASADFRELEAQWQWK